MDKTVDYWSMRYLSEEAFTPGDEVDQVRWFPVPQAAKTLTYGHDRAVLNAFAENDNVVPPAAVEPGSRVIGDPERRTELRLGGGHVTFATGARAFKQTLPAIADWLEARSDELDPPRER